VIFPAFMDDHFQVMRKKLPIPAIQSPRAISAPVVMNSAESGGILNAVSRQ
jgi:hypothetical protein